MAPALVENTQGSGLALLQPLDASSKNVAALFSPVRLLAAEHARRALANPNEPTLRVYATGDGHDVYQDSFMKVAKPEGQDFHPTLILVGTRLGIEKVTPVYWEALIASLQMRQSVGIAG
jgi:cysteine protease ATG4